MRAYLDILKRVRTNGELVQGRNGYTISAFGERFRHDLRNGFPILTTKEMPLKAPLAEMFAFLRGETNHQGFADLGCHIWKPWALEHEVSYMSPVGREKLIELAYAAGEIPEPTETALHEAITRCDKEIREFSAKRIQVAEAAVFEIADSRNKLLEKLNGIEDNEANKEKRQSILFELNALPDTDIDMQAISYEAMNKFMANNPQPKTLVERLKSKGYETMVRVVKNHKGDLGPIYGAQWRQWKSTAGGKIDQLKYVMDELKNDPHSRRIVLTGWNPEFIPPSFDKAQTMSPKEQVDYSIKHGFQALPPCHLMTIFKTTGYGRVLNLHQIMRSCDVPIGLPFNIAGYSYLLKIMAKQLNMMAGELIIDITDAHIYEKNVPEVSEQLKRDPMKLCEIEIPDGIDVLDNSTLTKENIDRIVAGISDYQSHPKIKMEVTV